MQIFNIRIEAFEKYAIFMFRKKNRSMLKRLLLVLMFSLILFSCQKNKQTTINRDIVKDSISLHLRKIARTYRYKNKRDSAYYYAYEAYKQASKTKDTVGIYSSLLILSQLDFFAHNYPAAEKNAFKALKYNIYDKEDIAYIYNLIGVIYWKKGNYYDALQYFKKIRSLLGKDYRKYPKVMSMYYNNMGLLNMDMKRDTVALQYFDSIIDLQKINANVSYASAINNKARVYYKQKAYDKAFPLMQEALKIREKTNDIYGVTRSNEFFAKYYHALKQDKLALDYAKKALAGAQKNNNPEEVLNTLKILNKIDTLNSNRYFSKYIKLQDTLLQDERKFKEQSAKIRYETQQKENEIARQELIIKQNNRILKIILGFLSVFITLTFILFYLNKKIQLQKQNLQSANRKLMQQKELLNNKNQLLEEKNEFIDNLHREMRHRFSDNMGALEASIGQLLKNPEHDERIDHILRKISGKITEMRLVQELLKYQGNTEAINMKEFIEKLANSIKHIFGQNEVEMIVEVDAFYLDMMQAKSLGAIVNEYLTNSFKYAFENAESGKVNITIKEKDNQEILVELSDNGKGLPADMDFKKLKSRGIIIIGLFIKKLKATLNYPDKKYLFNTNKGTKVSFVFKKHQLNL